MKSSANFGTNPILFGGDFNNFRAKFPLSRMDCFATNSSANFGINPNLFGGDSSNFRAKFPLHKECLQQK